MPKLTKRQGPFKAVPNQINLKQINEYMKKNTGDKIFGIKKIDARKSFQTNKTSNLHSRQ